MNAFFYCMVDREIIFFMGNHIVWEGSSFCQGHEGFRVKKRYDCEQNGLFGGINL